MKDPNWLFLASFTDGSRMTFYADNKPLAIDHAAMVARDTGKFLAKVTRLKHAKDVTPDELAASGEIFLS